MTNQAEKDEFRVLKAQMDKRYGTGKQRTGKQRDMRKRSDQDLDKYNQLVVADEQEVEHEYKNDYRGRVQDHQADMAFLPMFGLSFEPDRSEVKPRTMLFDSTVEQFNHHSGSHPLYVSTQNPRQPFDLIDTLTTLIARTPDMNDVRPLLLLRAVGRAALQNFEEAIADLDTYLYIDSTAVLAYWQRAVCQSRLSEFQAAQGTNVELRLAGVLNDLTHALRLDDRNPFLYYNRGNIYVRRGNLTQAVADYDRALALDPNLGEAWYNRGLARLQLKQTEQGIADLSKAGELGLYTAYSVIKKAMKK
jgi:tetratricopeptide (TPR) repeat protein